jgi:hypothetical protein
MEKELTSLSKTAIQNSNSQHLANTKVFFGQLK